MAASRHKKVDMPRPELNITAMMDLVLNLITFFVLVANFAAAGMPGLEPPDPTNSAAQKNENPNRINVNLMPNEEMKGRAGEMTVGSTKIAPGDLGTLVALLERELKISPNVDVFLRADKSIRYSDIEPIMHAVAGSGVQQFHVVAVTSSE